MSINGRGVSINDAACPSPDVGCPSTSTWRRDGEKRSKRPPDHTKTGPWKGRERTITHINGRTTRKCGAPRP